MYIIILTKNKQTHNFYKPEKLKKLDLKQTDFTV